MPRLSTQPQCLLDSFTQRFPQQREAKELLQAMASVIQTCTFNAERMHSKNLRRARKRVSVAVPDVKLVALSHMSFAGQQCFRGSECSWPPSEPQKRGRPAKSGSGQPATGTRMRWSMASLPAQCSRRHKVYGRSSERLVPTISSTHSRTASLLQRHW